MYFEDIMDFFAKHLPFTKTGYLWDSIPLYLWGIINALYLVYWSGFWLLVFCLIVALTPICLAILGTIHIWCSLRYITYPLLYTLIIGFIYPDGTAISKIKICWKTNLQSYSNFFDRFIKEDK